MAITDEKYVLFTTFRKDGTPVPTPVWIVAVGDGTAGFTTGADSGKAKRLAHTDRVTLQPCSARGKVTSGSEVIEATARVVTGPEAHRVAAAVKNKYRAMVALIDAFETVRGWFKKGAVGDCAVVIELPS